MTGMERRAKEYLEKHSEYCESLGEPIVFVDMRTAMVEFAEQETKELKAMPSKIIDCIKTHLCKQDEDYDKPVISPKFLSDTLDQMVMDGFEVK